MWPREGEKGGGGGGGKGVAAAREKKWSMSKSRIVGEKVKGGRGGMTVLFYDCPLIIRMARKLTMVEGYGWSGTNKRRGGGGG